MQRELPLQIGILARVDAGWATGTHTWGQVVCGGTTQIVINGAAVDLKQLRDRGLRMPSGHSIDDPLSQFQSVRTHRAPPSPDEEGSLQGPLFANRSNNLYFMRRMWDYFVTHLLGAQPPAGYRIHEPRDV